MSRSRHASFRSIPSDLGLGERLPSVLYHGSRDPDALASRGLCVSRISRSETAQEWEWIEQVFDSFRELPRSVRSSIKKTLGAKTVTREWLSHNVALVWLTELPGLAETYGTVMSVDPEKIHYLWWFRDEMMAWSYVLVVPAACPQSDPHAFRLYERTRNPRPVPIDLDLVADLVQRIPDKIEELCEIYGSTEDEPAYPRDGLIAVWPIKLPVVPCEGHQKGDLVSTTLVVEGDRSPSKGRRLWGLTQWSYGTKPGRIPFEHSVHVFLPWSVDCEFWKKHRSLLQRELEKVLTHEFGHFYRLPYLRSSSAEASTHAASDMIGYYNDPEEIEARAVTIAQEAAKGSTHTRPYWREPMGEALASSPTWHEIEWALTEPNKRLLIRKVHGYLSQLGLEHEVTRYTKVPETAFPFIYDRRVVSKLVTPNLGKISPGARKAFEKISSMAGKRLPLSLLQDRERVLTSLTKRWGAKDLWKGGRPTPRHLEMLAWGYTPTLKKTLRYAGPQRNPTLRRKAYLYRAADDDVLLDTASFAETREAAELYLNNPNFGGRHIWRTPVPKGASILDLTGAGSAEALERLGVPEHGAIGIDELVPRVATTLADAGYEWVKVPESYPPHTVTWIWIGGLRGELDPELERVA